MKNLFGILILSLLMVNSGTFAKEICDYCSPSCVCGTSPIRHCAYVCLQTTTNENLKLCQDKCAADCEICDDPKEICPEKCTIKCEASPWPLAEEYVWNSEEWKKARCPVPFEKATNNFVDEQPPQLPDMNTPGYEINSMAKF